MKKYFFTIFFSVLIVVFLFPVSVNAGWAEEAVKAMGIGLPCTTADSCSITKKCQTSNLEDASKYCVCQLDQDCSIQYGGEAKDWTCIDGLTSGMTANHNLNYCAKNDGTKEFPIPIAATTAVTANEGEKITFEPPKLSVLGPICKLMKIEGTTGEEVANSWMAQCLVGIYKYALVLGVMLAVLIIMIGGVMYLISGLNQTYVKSAKAMMVSAVLGIVVLASSYVILNIVNPSLVNLSSFTLEIIKGIEIEWEVGAEEHAESASATQASGSKPTDTAATERAVCSAEPSQASGSGNDKPYLGKLDCNTTKKRSLADIKHIIIHDGGPTASIVGQWTRECERGGQCKASHYSIEPNGTVYQLLDERKIGYHAGDWNNVSIGIDLVPSLTTFWRWGRIKQCVQACKDGFYEDRAIKSKRGIDFSDCPTKEQAITKCTNTYTDAQYVALNKLIEEISARTGVMLSNTSVHAHCESAHSDPRNFLWGKIGLTSQPHYDASDYAKRACKFHPLWEERVQEVADEVFGE